MNQHDKDMSTDVAWEEWGRRDAYFGVITNPKYRRSEIQEADRREFFESGHWHVNYVIKTIHDHIDPNFKPGSILDFGCGVGRTLVSFAQIAQEAVGLDVSPSMLQEANNNCRDRGLTNVRLLRSDDALSALAPSYDLIHSCIVFQHIPLERGRRLFRRLLTLITPRGIGAFHFLYSKSQYEQAYGVPPATTSAVAAQPPHGSFGSDPQIQMNPYNMTEILFLMQTAGVRRFYADFTDHGGELGLFLFFQTN
jgi:2-polyprenyl-3-methyl-5-hydroxy-6-metoxy-1,4-benzoquinol methylase